MEGLLHESGLIYIYIYIYNKFLFDIPLALWKMNLQYANSHPTSMIKVKHKIL